MSFVYVKPNTSWSGNTNTAAKSHAAKLGAAKRREARQRLVLDCLRGGPLPANRRLVITLPPRQRQQSSVKPLEKRRHCCDHKYTDPERAEEEDVLALARNQHRPSPLNIIGKGNSDPFSSTVVVIDATANHLLGFSHDCFVPWIDSMEEGPDKIKSFRNKFVQTPLEAIHNEVTAHATLATMAIVLSNSTKDQGTRSHGFSLIGIAYEALQTRISSSASDQSMPLRIFTLFVFEFMAGNNQAAAIHAHALQKVLQQHRKEGQPISPFLLSAAMFQDNNRSLIFVQRPIIDLELILEPDLFDEVDKFAERLRQHELLDPERPDQLAETGFPPRVSQLLTRWGYLMRVARGFSSEGSRYMTKRTQISWAQHAAMFLRKLLIVFHDARGNLAVGIGDQQLLHRQAASALAIMYWVMVANHFDSHNHSTARWWKHGYASMPVSRSTLPELSREIHAIDWTRTAAAPPSLRLWLLYVTMLAEQSLANAFGTTKGQNRFHTMELVGQASRMGLWKWEDVESELKRYLYDEYTSPTSKAWFERAMDELIR